LNIPVEVVLFSLFFCLVERRTKKNLEQMIAEKNIQARTHAASAS
jgi:hypothetical protein